ncbi:MAG: TIGR04222 domain-containing membrane protein [Xanthomonadales bacterium]|nr:TIGR04222 domain-containing membrane protein [Xanthomonadales bacterium]
MANPVEWHAATQERWQAIQPWLTDQPLLKRRFIAQLAEKTGWSAARLEQGVEEYRRFCLLATVLGGRVVPSPDVDEVWHLHLTYTRDYWDDFCPRRLGLKLHHQPALGVEGEREALRLGYAETLHAYAALFGPPSESWWPSLRGPAPKAPWWRAAHARWLAAASLSLALFSGVAWADTGSALGILDWKGPQFLALFLPLIPASMVLAWILRWRMRAASASPSRTVGQPSVWAVAWLAGGEQRVMDAAVAELHRRGALEWNEGSGTLRSTGVKIEDDPVLNAAMVVAARDKGVEFKSGTRSTAFSGVRKELELRGWLLPEPVGRGIARLSALFPGALLALGIVKIGIGISRDKPVAFLVMACIALLIVTLLFFFIRPKITPQGRKALSELRQQNAHAIRAPRPDDLAMAVALGGTLVLSDTALAAYHQARHAANGPSGGDSGSGCTSCSGGGDSGGGDGGGGCGGCGGGD